MSLGAIPRLALSFPTFQNVQYMVLFRQSNADSGTAIAFSTTETGAASTMTLTGTGTPGTVYGDHSSPVGFYSIAVTATQG